MRLIDADRLIEKMNDVNPNAYTVPHMIWLAENEPTVEKRIVQGKCDYCENEVAIGYDGAGDAIYIERGEDVSILSSDSWEIEIGYCPMCGRKLCRD